MRIMNKRMFASAGVIAGVLALVAAAASLAPVPSTVAVVDLGRVFNSLNAWTAFQEAKVAMAQDAQKDALAQRERIEELQADLEDFPEASERHRSALLALQLAAIEFEASLTFRERQLQRFDSKSIRNLYESIRAGAAKFAESNGYDMVIVDDGVDAIPEDAPDPIAMISSRRVLFARDRLDITDALVAAMNAAFRSGSGG
jgi:Skp family chaperone for outer membrane proteins